MIINAFIVDTAKIDNADNVVAPYGEISTEARTYSKDIKEHSLGGTLSAVILRVESTTSNTAVDPNTIAKIKQVHEGITGLTASNPTAAMIISYMSTLGITATSIDNPAHVANGNSTAYGKLGFNFNGDIVTLWYNDDYIRAKYPYTDFEVILPVTTLQDLEATQAEMLENIAKTTPSDLHVKTETAKGDDPYTSIHTDMIGLFESGVAVPSTDSIPTPFTVIAWGPKGKLYSERLSAIKEYIIAHAGTKLTEWQEHIGRNIFGGKAMIIFPFWKEILDEDGPDPVAYMSLMNVSERLEEVKVKLPSFSPDHIDKNVTFMPMFYRYMTLAFVPAPNNDDENKDLSVMFPDFVSAPNEPGNHSFSRMSLGTRDFINFIYELTVKAENKSTTHTFTHAFTETEEDGVIYIASDFTRNGTTTPLSYKMIKRGP